ncbi:hypothetical protein [Bacillus thuringiensis]|uniref:hypothetical protein n=1 Tax=Bacillus thuringiensis TaxID=1428 RepID=UPI0005AF2C32|nr:hypothetical protein [Bacillus thuringiensis]KIP27879.1 hypothetical protein BG10_1762 [Bacillus thuringiensis serovar morrisoni]MCT6946536.1 hypothetical protein [Bacillus thuringiensis]MED2078460.1 hypothetical protein [Bacillus thuringiensis]MEE2015383.1 hypothetical protein [Bacillus thuringiensis]NUW47281.1 hypothetical protein [Bacillus thuringiensis]
MKIVTAKSSKKNRYNRLLAEEDLYSVLEEMGNTKAMIDKFQKRRLLQSFVMCIFGLLLGLFLSSWCYLIAIGLPIFLYRSKYTHVTKVYSAFKFERHLNFSKFTRLLIPYLKEAGESVSLYQVFRKILNRMEKPVDKNSLAKLMSEMTDKPDDIQPFTDYAMRSSGSDMSINFMQTVYDFQQNSSDTNVINELGQIASAELQRAIDEIIAFKLRRFNFFPTKMVMSSFILVVGFAAAVLVYHLSSINLS